MSAQDMLVERIDNLCKERNMSYYTLSYNLISRNNYTQVEAKGG